MQSSTLPSEQGAVLSAKVSSGGQGMGGLSIYPLKPSVSRDVRVAEIMRVIKTDLNIFLVKFNKYSTFLLNLCILSSKDLWLRL